MASGKLLVFFIWREYVAQLRMYAVGFHFSGLLLPVIKVYIFNYERLNYLERLTYLTCCNMSAALTLILSNFLFISNLIFDHITKLQLLVTTLPSVCIMYIVFPLKCLRTIRPKFSIIGLPFVKRCYWTVVCPVCLSVTLVCCGQTAGSIRMPLGMEVGLGPGDIGLDGDPAPPPPWKGAQHPPFFGPCLLWPNGCINQDTTWYRGRPQPRQCVRWGPSYLHRKGHSSPAPLFGLLGSVMVTHLS